MDTSHALVVAIDKVTGWRSVTAPSHAAPGARYWTRPAQWLRGLLTVAAMTITVHASACTEKLGPPGPVILPQVFKATCGIKNECAPSDQLTITQSSSESKSLVASATLVVGEFCEVLVKGSSEGTDAQASVTIALAPIVGKWIENTAMHPSVKPYFESSDVKVGAAVLVNDQHGRRHSIPLTLDLTELWRAGHLGWAALEPKHTLEGGFGRVLTIPVANVNSWQRAHGTGYSKLAVLFNGAQVSGVTVNGDPGKLLVALHRNASNQEAWQPVLEAALAGQPVAVAVADEHGRMLLKGAQLRLAVMPFELRLGIVVVIGALLAFAVRYLGRRTEWAWLRDDYGLPIKDLPVAQRPFSLGKVQMLLWSFVIALATLSIIMVFVEIPVVPTTAVALMGISLTTGVTASAIVPKFVTDSVAAHKADPYNPTWLAPLRSESFFKDIFRNYGSQSQGADVHRLQAFCLTLAIGAAFLYLSFQQARYPAIDSLLALMGLSNAGYVGFKYTDS